MIEDQAMAPALPGVPQRGEFAADDPQDGALGCVAFQTSTEG